MGAERAQLNAPANDAVICDQCGFPGGFNVGSFRDSLFGVFDCLDITVFGIADAVGCNQQVVFEG